MKNLVIRRMQLKDAQAIVKIDASDFDGWVDKNEGSGTFTTEYMNLSLTERFAQGGPGVSLETCAVLINNLLTHEEAFPLVAEQDGLVVAHAEMFIGNEPGIFGRNAHLSDLYVHRDYRSVGIGSALLTKCLHLAMEHQCDTFSVLPSADAIPFYKRYHFMNAYPQKRLSVTISKEYPRLKAVEHWGLPYAAFNIPMRMGRLQSSVQMWHQATWQPYVIEGSGPKYPMLRADLKDAAYLTALQVFNQPEAAYVFAWADERVTLSELVQASFSICAERNFKKAMLIVPENEVNDLMKIAGGECVGNHDLWVKKLLP